jgi:excisionase family DNA binding protein
VVKTTASLALGVDEAAAAIGVSRDTFERHVLADLHVVRVGRRVVVPVRELERYLERVASRPLQAELAALRR